MKIMKLKSMTLKKKSRAPLSTQAAIAAGGLLLAWGYRRWSRRKASLAEAGGKAGADVRAGAGKLAEKFHSLDAESRSGHIPKDLEREPKNLEQSTHPG